MALVVPAALLVSASVAAADPLFLARAESTARWIKSVATCSARRLLARAPSR